MREEVQLGQSAQGASGTARRNCIGRGCVIVLLGAVSIIQIQVNNYDFGSIFEMMLNPFLPFSSLKTAFCIIP